MASSMDVDSDDEDLLQPSITSKTWIITPDMVEEVLAVCPNTCREAIKRDLYQTRSVSSTINRILDGENVCDNTTSLPDNPIRDKLPGIIADVVSSLQAKKTINCLSDTDIDTDTDDSEIVIVNEKRETIFTSLKERLGKTTIKNADGLSKEDKKCNKVLKSNTNLSTNEKIKMNYMHRTNEIQDFSFTNEHCNKMEVDHEDDDDNDVVLVTLEKEKPELKCLEHLPKKQPKNNHNVSEIIALSFVDDENHENFDANDLATNAEENNKSAPFHEQLDTLNIDVKKSKQNSSKQKSDKNVCLRIESDDDSGTCAARLTGVSASESESEDLPSFFVSKKLGSSSPQNEMELSQGQSHDDEDIPRKKKKGNAEKTRKRNEEKKLLKEREKQKKKERAEKEKLEKQKAQLTRKKQKEADALNQKSQKKEECMKAIEVCMDPDLLFKGASDADVDPIIAKLRALGVSYSLQTQPIPKSITWKRTTVEHQVGEDLEIESHKTYSDENNVIVRLDIEAFISLVDDFKNACLGSVNSFCSNLTSTYTNKTVTVVIVGLEKYFRDIKNRQNRQFRNAVRGDTNTTEQAKSKSRKTKNGQNVSSVTVKKVEVEELLVYMELISNIKITVCETEQEFAEFVGMFTKALAEAPFKKSQPETFSFCVDFGKKPPVKVAKDGSGLLKLWQQQLQQYHNVSANMAAAIVSVYPSPQLLVQAYRQCADEKNASLLLKDIVVRRGEGVLSTSRRIGPELSRQIYILFNSTDGQTLTK